MRLGEHRFTVGGCEFWHDVVNMEDFDKKMRAMYPGIIPVTSDKGIPSTFKMIRDVRGWAQAKAAVEHKGERSNGNARALIQSPSAHPA